VTTAVEAKAKGSTALTPQPDSVHGPEPAQSTPIPMAPSLSVWCPSELKMQAVHSSETSVTFCRTTLRHKSYVYVGARLQPKPPPGDILLERQEPQLRGVADTSG
jgi:hypothetical protein